MLEVMAYSSASRSSVIARFHPQSRRRTGIISHAVAWEIDGEAGRTDDDVRSRACCCSFSWLQSSIAVAAHSLSYMIWHFAAHADDCRRLVAQPTSRRTPPRS
jgi:hypothetical protein